MSADICKVNAGAVAVILARGDMARVMPKKPVWLHATGRQQGVRGLENENHFLCYGMLGAAEQVYGAAGMTPKDIDILFVYEAASSAVLHTLENYGFCQKGESGDFVKNGRIEIGGDLPVNPNGGHLSEGYLVGWLHHAELVRQLRGECGARQVGGARIAQYCQTGGFREHYCSNIFVAD
jgi:acetyl-CoA acetyltransferase